MRARLLRLAKQSDANFNVVLVRFATERLLYRLSPSPHADRFVLKGAWLFCVWDLGPWVTRDLDLLGFGDTSPAAMEEVFRDVLASSVEPDSRGTQTAGPASGTVHPNPVRPYSALG